MMYRCRYIVEELLGHPDGQSDRCEYSQNNQMDRQSQTDVEKTNSYMERQTDRQTDRQKDRQTDRQTDRKTERKKDRQTDKYLDAY